MNCIFKCFLFSRLLQVNHCVTDDSRGRNASEETRLEKPGSASAGVHPGREALEAVGQTSHSTQTDAGNWEAAPLTTIPPTPADAGN